MAPNKKSKNFNKREASREMYSSKSKQRKKDLTKKMGPKWTRGEIERFYDAYRKYGGDWRKVAAAVRTNRSADMVEALFCSNRAYLSLPEGTASVVGFTAMVTDQYNSIEMSESEGEGHNASRVVRKYKKQKRPKVPPIDFRQVVIPPKASAEGCLSFLRQTRANVIERRATGRRTPRFLVPSNRDDNEGSTPPTKRAKKQYDDDRTQHRRTELNESRPTTSQQAKVTESSHHDRSTFENCVKTSRERRRNNGESDRDGTVIAEENDSDEALRDGLDGLYALAELSCSLPVASLMESESSAQLREEAKQAGPEDNIKPKSVQESVHSNATPTGDLGTSRKKRKPKVLGSEASQEPAEDNMFTNFVKLRRGQGPAKPLKIAKTSEESSSISDKNISVSDAAVSATQVSALVPDSLTQKPPNRRKISLKKSLQQRVQSSETTHGYKKISVHELLKEKVSTCLSYPFVRRRCVFEWFYSAIDYPWFAKTEFADYLNHVGLGHVPRLTRLEWSVIKSSLGRPRRFSERFVEEERDKLKQYRESVRKHYTDFRGGVREVLPADLAQPLSVGNRVIAIHPKTREIRDGKILTVDHNKCNVLFDELGVDLVMDIDCMPLNPLEYMPEGLRRKIDKCLSVSKEKHMNPDASLLFAPSCVIENVNNPVVKKDDINAPILNGKVFAIKTSDDTNSKARGNKSQQQHTSDTQEMEPEMIEIFSGSKYRAQSMVDAAIKDASMVKKDQDAENMVQQALNGEHQPLDNGSLDHHESRFPSNTAEPVSQDGSGKTEIQMPSELISSCVATWLMIQMCTDRQYPPGDVAQLMETAVNGLQPRCPQNMPIYREIETCMGWIKTQIMALVRT